MAERTPVQSVPTEKQSGTQTEQDLFELQSIYDTAPIGLCLFDTNLRYKRINTCLARINGLPVEAHIGKTVREVVPQLADLADSLLQKILETGQPLLNVELKGETASQPGITRYWLENWYPLKAPDGTVTGINVTVEEITDRKRAEEELSLSHRRLHHTLASIKDDFYVLDREWRFVFTSEKFTGRIGKRPEDFIGNVIWQMFPKHLGSVLEENFRAAMDGREVRRFEVSGKYTDAVYRMTAFPSAEGITVLGIDITEQKKTETALRESETRYRMLHESLRDAFVQVSMDGKIIAWNDHYCRMLGYTPEELLRLTYRDLTPENWHAAEEDIVRTQILPRGYSDIFEKEYRRKDGSVLPVELRAVLSRDETGEPSSMWAIVRDISERKRAEERLNMKNAVLSAITRILHAALTSGTEADLGTLCLSVLEEITGSLFGFIGELNPETGLFDDIAVSDHGWAACRIPGPGSPGGKLPAGHKIHGLYGRVLTEGKPLFTNDPSSHPASIGTPPGHPQLSAFLGVPLEKQGKILGMIGLGNKQGGYDRWDVEAVEALAPIIVQAFSRKRAEEALRIERDKLKAVYDNIPVGTLITNANVDFLYMNPAALEIHGFASEHEMLSSLEQYQAVFELLYPDRRKCPLEMWPAVRALNGEYVRDFECRLVNRRQGTERYLSYTTVPILDESGAVTSVIFNLVDLTEEKRIEESLQESELFYRQTLESIPGMVFTTRPDGYCDYQSRQWVEFTGVPAEEHFGDGWNRLLHPDDRQSALTAWREAVAGATQYNLEYRVRRRDGEYEWFKVIGKPILDALGGIVRWFGIAANVDELKKARDAEHAAKELAEHANRAKTEFLAHMSHEIRTPIAGIIGMADIVSSRTRDPEKKEYLDLIRSSANSLLTVIGDILDLSRIESGVVNLELSEWNVREELKKIVTPFSIPAKSKGLRLSMNIAPGVPGCMFADGDKVAQVLRNLISNAVKYTESGAVTVAVSLGGESEKRKKIQLSVEDTGIGIEAEKKQAIFESFVRLRRSVTERNVEGTGLGLTITKRLVELMGGSITVESEPGKGSTFSVVLELEQAECRHSPEPARDPSLADIPPLSILVVEDNRINQMFLEISLKEAGHRVTVAGNGSEALEVLSRPDSAPLDLVLMDVQMPIMDGIEATRGIRSLAGPVSGIPIIALTAFAMQGDEERFREAGMNGYVTKPVDWNELTRVIREVSG